MPDLATASLFGETEDRNEQFRLARVQLFNWGTFRGVHTFAVPAKGYLVMGASGSGKSTLLDAYTALLTPQKWVDFNVAAAGGRQAARDRSYLSYVRGAVREKTADNREILKEYIRPQTTWSAIAATFTNPLGRVVTLAQLLYVRGSSTAAKDLNRRFLVLARPFDVTELQPFAEHNFDVKRLRAVVHDAQHFDEFSRYSATFRQLLGIEHEQALRLLHKTQSVKNLEDLNEFLRDFALDPPATFDIAHQLVTDFTDLNAAHTAVVIARQQLALLNDVRDRARELDAVGAQQSALDEVKAGLEHYERARRLDLLQAALANALAAEQASRDAAAAARERARAAEDKLLSMRSRRIELGAGVIEQLANRKADAERDRDARVRRRDELTATCKLLGWTAPDAPIAFSALAEAARVALDKASAGEEQAEARRDELVREKDRAEQAFRDTTAEVKSLQRQRSNVDARRLGIRGALAEAIGLPESKLPFVAELLQVRAAERAWEGAIERVLRNFALSLLVPDTHYQEVAAYLNRTHIGDRLVWLRAIPHARQAPSPSVRSLVRKVEVAEGPYREWLSEELCQRFDYECTPDVELFTRATRAVTMQGQVKHGPGRHEKDDRFEIDNRSGWVLGFDNSAKRELFERKAQEIAGRLAALEAELMRLKESAQKERLKFTAYQRVANWTWEDVDVGTMLDRIRTIDEQLAAERDKRPDLARLEDEIRQQAALAVRLKEHADAADAALMNQSRTVHALGREIETEQSRPAVTLTPTQQKALDERYAAVGRTLTLESLQSIARAVERDLASEERTLAARRTNLENTIGNALREFIRQWPAEAGDMDASTASIGPFLEKRDRLEADGLPRHEARFKQLLRDQSDRNLTRLLTQLVTERRAIVSRIDTVNESLRGAEFNPGTYLEIQPTERALEDVRVFQAQLKAANSQSFVEDEATAETRFVALAALVKRLGSQASEDTSWRNLVLDVRLHVEFVAREYDEAGVEREVYRSGKGKSGGQRQKLASTCLAAALRYQLGGAARRLPTFGTVVLDEAFNNADPDFTTMALNIFTVFGFQVVVATPMKSVMAMEPFVGGAVMVTIDPDNSDSRPRLIEYDEVEQRLPIRPEDLAGAEHAAQAS